MESPVPGTPRNYPVGFEPLPFPKAGDMNVMGREIHCYYTVRDYGYLKNGHCADAIIRSSGCRLSSDMTDFSGKGHPSPEFRTRVASIYRILIPSDRRVFLVILISHHLTSYDRGCRQDHVPHSADVCYFATISQDMHFSFLVVQLPWSFRGRLETGGYLQDDLGFSLQAASGP